MSKLLEIEVGEKKYYLGYPTRKDAINAENNGLDITEAGKIISLSDKLFYTGLLAKQPKTTNDEADEIFQQYVSEGGDVTEITQFLVNQYVAFTKSPNGKKKKKAKIIEM